MCRRIVVELLGREEPLTDGQERSALFQKRHPVAQTGGIGEPLQEDLVVPLDQSSKRFLGIQKTADHLLMGHARRVRWIAIPVVPQGV